MSFNKPMSLTLGSNSEILLDRGQKSHQGEHILFMHETYSIHEFVIQLKLTRFLIVERVIVRRGDCSSSIEPTRIAERDNSESIFGGIIDRMLGPADPQRATPSLCIDSAKKLCEQCGLDKHSMPLASQDSTGLQIDIQDRQCTV